MRRDRFGRKITPGAENRAERPAVPAGPRTPAGSTTPAGPRPSGRPAPDIRVSPIPQAKQGPSGAMATVFLLTTLGAVVLAGFWYGTTRPDPHYVKARDMVRSYEAGRTVQARNYGNAVYADALNELALVDSGSVSAAPARALQVRIEREIRDFNERRVALERARAADLAKQQRREKEVLAARRRAIAFPVTEYPECEEEHPNKSGRHRD